MFISYEQASHDAYFFILINADSHDNSFDILFQNSASRTKLFSATCLSFLLRIVYSILHYCTIWITEKHKMRLPELKESTVITVCITSKHQTTGVANSIY